MRRVSPILSWLTIHLLLTLSLLGCHTSKATSRIGHFAAATKELERGVSDSFDVAERANERAYLSRTIRDTQRALALPAADNEQIDLRNAALRDAIGGFNPSQVAPLLSNDDLKARLDVLEGLTAYADRLSLIMGNQPLDAIDQRSRDLGAALQALSKNSVLSSRFSDVTSAVAPDRVAIFETALSTLGRWLIDGYRQHSVPKAIDQMNPHIEGLCDLLQRDIGTAPKPDGTGASGLRGILWNKYTDMLDDHKQWLEAAATADPALTPREVRDEVERTNMLWNSYRDADGSLAATADAIEAMSDAHARLGLAFDKDMTELDELISIFRKEVSRIRDYHVASLKSAMGE